MDKQRVLITVKTYPTLSKKYGETVCTAGLRPDGTWVRMYPVPYRRLEEGEQYRKFDWLDCRLIRHEADPRPESHRPVDQSELKAVGHVDTSNRWSERRRVVLGTARVYDSLDELIGMAKANESSLAIFKPAKVSGFIWEDEAREWDAAKVKAMRDLHSQLDIFDEASWRKTFEVIPKLPYSFSYRFSDSAGRKSELQVLDWEVGALYWNCLRSCNGDEAQALKKVRAKYLDEFLKTDLHFFLGTTQEWHTRAPNPWVIVGVFPIPHESQLGLELP